MFSSTKTFGHEVGLSCCFRQWRAESHCQLLHGYAIAVRLQFEASELDKHKWVVDFGGLKHIKEWLQENFDHTLLVARDDPKISQLLELQVASLARVVVLHDVGCESFARHIYDHVDAWLKISGYKPRVQLSSVEVREHGANSAIYTA